jgi:hypothetical protein
VLFDQLYEVREHAVERGAGCDHPEDFLLPGAEVCLPPSPGNVA